jgi:hypothetical protein
LAFNREAKRTLPRPKVGDFCSTAMEQGFSDVCVAYCMNQVPVARVAQTCRAASIEMPRPTVRKWCEHGYTVAYEKTKNDLKNYFKAVESEPEAIKEEEVKEEVKQPEPEPVAQPEPVVEKKVIAVIPVTLNENETHDLKVMEGQNVEDAVVSFCREHVSSDVAACIRTLLPDVLERYNADEGHLRGSD